MIDDRSATELADNDVRVFEEIRMEEFEEEKKASNQSSPQHHQKMMRNLEDVFSFIQNQSRQFGPCDYDRVIRPIKIESPAMQSAEFGK